MSDKFKKLVEETTETLGESIEDDIVQENAEFRAKENMKTYIIRETDGECCEWCTSLAGRYEYGNHPKDIFRRHANCGCSVTYISAKSATNTWTKKERLLNKQEIQQLYIKTEKEIEESRKANRVIIESKPFTDFSKKIKKNWNSVVDTYNGIKDIKSVDERKKIFENTLKKLGFQENYFVGGIDGRFFKDGKTEEVILSRSNMAYILQKHGNQFSGYDVLDHMDDMLKNYGIMAKGKTGGEGDFVFFKIVEINGKKHGYEMKMNKRPNYPGEYIVHLLETSDKKSINKMIKKYTDQDAILDKKVVDNDLYVVY